MKLVRTWPASIPEGRSYVVDQIPRVVVDRYDNTPLLQVGDDLLVVEWDLAIEPAGLRQFRDFALAEPDRIAVAPYRLYRYGPSAFTAKARPLGRPVWAHRVEAPDGGFRHVTEQDPACHYFGIGLVYLPRALLLAYQADRQRDTRSDWGFSDGSLSAWHWRVVNREVPIAWDVRPVHLHYDIKQEWSRE